MAMVYSLPTEDTGSEKSSNLPGPLQFIPGLVLASPLSSAKGTGTHTACVQVRWWGPKKVPPAAPTS